MNSRKIGEHIRDWMLEYCKESTMEGFVVGISGGIDSALTSTLCAMTGLRTIAVTMPIRQSSHEFDRAVKHLEWLKSNYSNVEVENVVLTPVFESIEKTLPKEVQDFLTMANTRARLRMLTLYAFAGRHKLLVAGTGNKIEDFGVGFYTKYGDGGVDISPIADLYKTEVYAVARELGVIDDIIKAAPTDGLFADGRTDEDQLGASYAELEWAMSTVEDGKKQPLNARQQHVMEIYLSRHKANRHKMDPIPVCKIPAELKK